MYVYFSSWVHRMSLLGWRAASQLTLVTSHSWSVCRQLSKSYATLSPNITRQNFANRDALFLTPCSFLQCQNRYYAKGKDKKGKSEYCMFIYGVDSGHFQSDTVLFSIWSVLAHVPHNLFRLPNWCAYPLVLCKMLSYTVLYSSMYESIY